MSFQGLFFTFFALISAFQYRPNVYFSSISTLFCTHPVCWPHIGPKTQWHQTPSLLFHWRKSGLLSLWGWWRGAASSAGLWWLMQPTTLQMSCCLLSAIKKKGRLYKLPRKYYSCIFLLYWQAKTFRKKSPFKNNLNSHPNRSPYLFVMGAIIWCVCHEAEKMQILRVNIAYNTSTPITFYYQNKITINMA